MTRYTADFRTDANYATHAFEADTPEAALRLAQALYDDEPDQLWFESYDEGQPVVEIAIHNSDGDQVALWQDDDLRVRLAAHDLLAALELCADCLADLARLDDGTPSISALNDARDAIAKAKGGRS